MAMIPSSAVCRRMLKMLYGVRNTGVMTEKNAAMSTAATRTPKSRCLRIRWMAVSFARAVLSMSRDPSLQA